MDRPVKKTMEYLDFIECSKYIEERNDIDLRDYSKSFEREESDEFVQHRDFWHSILDRNDNQIHNGSFFYLDVVNWLDDECAPIWEKAVVEMFRCKFNQYIVAGKIKFWMKW